MQLPWPCSSCTTALTCPVAGLQAAAAERAEAAIVIEAHADLKQLHHNRPRPGTHQKY